MYHALRAKAACFNPRPPLLASVCSQAGFVVGGRDCFNPRPPLLASVWHMHLYQPEPMQVSIRARHCWRACVLARRLADLFRVFQSAPAIAGERVRARSVYSTQTRLFQSAPAIAGERVLMRLSVFVLHIRFNPRPPLLASVCTSQS